MSEQMQQAYIEAGALKYYFDKEVPVNLWRGLKKSVLTQREKEMREIGASVPANFAQQVSVEPVTLGFEIVTKQGKRWRQPDVEVFERNGELWIRGCRTTRAGGNIGGSHFGIKSLDSPPWEAG
jgi:hypothetical protein